MVGRRRMCIEGKKCRRTLSLSPEVSNLLDFVDNASGTVDTILKAALSKDQAAQLDLEARQIDMRIINLETMLLDAKKQKAGIEDRRRVLTARKDGKVEARLKLLETINQVEAKQRKYGYGGLNLPSWISSRVSDLVECDFKDAPEAVAWIEQQRQAVVQ